MNRASDALVIAVVVGGAWLGVVAFVFLLIGWDTGIWVPILAMLATLLTVEALGGRGR